MEPFFGKWKVQLEKSSGVEELGKLFGWDEAKRTMYATSSYTLLIEAKGDGYSAFLDYTQFKFSIEFKLGQEVEYSSPDGTTAMVTVTIDGGNMIEAYRTKEGVKWNTLRKIDGNIMVAETTSPSDSSVKCVQHLVKV